MTNRLFKSLFFVLLLVFAQQQALLHPYEHSADWQQKSSNHKNSLPHSDTCGKCIALAGIASAVGSKTQSVAVLPAKFEFASSAKLLTFSTHFQPYLSRAPPYLA